MFAVGHLALGYLIGKASSKILNTKVTPSLIFLFAVLPDIDLFIPFLRHRGPTHSITALIITLILTSLLIGRKAIPYSIVYLQHLIPGDYLADGGIQLLWPINKQWYSLEIYQGTRISTSIEIIAFIAFLLFMWKTRDLRQLFRPQALNLILLVPLVSLSSPLIIEFPIPVPPVLIPLHLAYMALFTTALLTDIKHHFKSKYSI